MPPTLSADVCVLGGGPAGLATAWWAAQRGLSVTLLERDARLGGLAASVEVGGIRVDMGSHRLHPSTAPHVMAQLRTLLGEDLQLRRRNGRLRLDGRWIGFPLHPTALLREAPPRFLAAAARDAAVSPLRRPGSDTYAEVLRAGLGPALYERFYAPYARKLWGVAPEELSGETARRRVAAGSPVALLGKVLRGARSGDGTGRVFHYPRRGFGQIVDVLGDAAAAAGADVRTEAAVTGLSLSGRGAVVRCADGTTVHAGRVLSTLPLPLLTRLVEGTPTTVAEDARSLRTRAMCVVHVVHEGRPWTPFDAHYLPSLDTPLSRLSEPASYRDSAEDPQGRTVLCAELPCDVGDATWTSSDEALAELVVAAARDNDLPPVRVSEVVVHRLPSVYPVHLAGAEPALDRVRAWADALPSLTTLGRQGRFVHDNTHHALAMAWEAAHCAGADGSWDVARWSGASARFAAHVVED